MYCRGYYTTAGFAELLEFETQPSRLLLNNRGRTTESGTENKHNRRVCYSIIEAEQRNLAPKTNTIEEAATQYKTLLNNSGGCRKKYTKAAL